VKYAAIAGRFGRSARREFDRIGRRRLYTCTSSHVRIRDYKMSRPCAAEFKRKAVLAVASVAMGVVSMTALQQMWKRTKPANAD